MPTTGRRPQGVRDGKTSVWLLPSTLEVEPLLVALGQSFVVSSEAARKTVTTWFDTFDWRLYGRNLLLYHDCTAWHLVSRDSAVELAALDTREQDQWRFCQDFPASRVRSLLEPLLACRRLLPLFSNETTTVGVRIQNDDGKTVAKVMIETHRVEGSAAVVPTLCLRGMRGYDRDFREISRFFGNYGIKDRVGAYSFFEQGVRSGGKVPLDYTSRFRPILRPEMSARKAMVVIYSDLLETMQRNEAGIVEDLDPEFLHDFRVAVRRTRSGFSQIRKVLPTGVTDAFRKGFAWLGVITGPTRDLDVYLQSEHSYRARLPEELRLGLEPFFVDLRRRRGRAQVQLVRQLRSKKYRDLVSAWQKYLASGGRGEVTKNSRLPVAELAGRIIFCKFSMLLKDAKALRPSSPDRDYHLLRIQGKKLRYILEFFAALFPEKALALTIKQLKHLQDNLGGYNDLTVQQEMLREYLAGLRPGSRRNQELAAAIGGLLASLSLEQSRVREEFAERFAEFSRPENTELYRRIFRQRR